MAFGSKSTFTTKEQQVLCGSAKGMFHFPKLLLLHRNKLNFHIFVKFYLYILCANELLNQQSEPGTGNTSPWQTCQRPYPLFPMPAGL